MRTPSWAEVLVFARLTAICCQVCVSVDKAFPLHHCIFGVQARDTGDDIDNGHLQRRLIGLPGILMRTAILLQGAPCLSKRVRGRRKSPVQFGLDGQPGDTCNLTVLAVAL